MVDGITDSMDMNMSKFWETVEDRGGSCAAVYGIPKSQTWPGNWVTTTTQNVANKDLKQSYHKKEKVIM